VFALAPGLNVLSLGAGAGALSSAAKPTVELEGQATQTRVVIVCHGGCGGVVTNEVSEGFGSANFFFYNLWEAVSDLLVISPPPFPSFLSPQLCRSLATSVWRCQQLGGTPPPPRPSISG
jgi:hypothetical protein